MAEVMEMERPLYCAFCGREKVMVEILAQGCYGVCICDRCIEDASKILLDWREAHDAKRA